MKSCSNAYCSKNNPQPPEEFYADKRLKDGLQSDCRTCRLSKSKKYYENNTDKCLAAMKSRRTLNPDKVRSELENWHKNNPYWRIENSLKVKFKMTLAQYDEMLKDQCGCCAICNRHNTEFKKRLSVDHDHSCCPGKITCGKCVRSLLCEQCNKALGFLQDSSINTQSATNYLIRHRK